MEEAIKMLAKRDFVPEATKAAELLKHAIEIEEDVILMNLAKSRDTKGAEYVSKDDFWKNLNS